MTLALQHVPGDLQAIAATLGHDRDIQRDVRVLITTGNNISSKFSDVVRNEGGNILQQMSSLMTAVTPGDVDIEAMQNTLKAGRDSFGGIKMELVSMQVDVHSNIEKCRGRKLTHEREICHIEESITVLHGQIEGLTENIATFEEDAKDSDNKARQLEERADDLRNAAKQKKGWGMLGMFAGAVFAPFTFGTSLAVGGLVLAVNLYDASDCDQHARNYRCDSTDKRSQASALRTRTSEMFSQKASKKSEITKLQITLGDLAKASASLEDINAGQRTAIQVMDNVISALQDAAVELQKAKLQGGAFKIIQNSFMRNPQKLGTVADASMDQLKEKWIHVENLLISQGARPLQ